MKNKQWQLNRQGEYIRVGIDANTNKINIAGFNLNNGGFLYELPMGNHIDKNFHQASLEDYPQENSLLLRFYYPGRVHTEIVIVGMSSVKQSAKTTPVVFYQKGVLDLSKDPIKHTLVCACEWFDQEYKIIYKLIDLQHLHSYQKTKILCADIYKARLIKYPGADYIVAIETSRYQDMVSILKIDNDGRVNRSAFVHHDDTVPSYYFGVNNETCVFLVKVTEQGSTLYTLKNAQCNPEHIENKFYAHKLTCHGETLRIQGMKKESAIPSMIMFDGVTKDITYQECAHPSNTRTIQLRDLPIVSSASSATEEKKVSILYFYGSYGRPVSLLDHPWINTTNNRGIAINCYVLLMPGGGEYGPQWHRKGIHDKYRRQRQWLRQAIEYICSIKQDDEKLILETNSAGAVAAISYYRDESCIDGMILNSPFLHLPSVLENQPPELLDKQDQYEWRDVEKNDRCLSLFGKNNRFAPILIFSGEHDTITPREKILEWVESNRASNIKPIDIVDIASGGHGFSCNDRHIANRKKLDFLEGIFV